MAKEVRKVHISVTSNASQSMTKGTVAATGLSGALKGVGTSANLATGGIRAMTAALISSGVGAIVVAIGALIGGLGTVINKSKAFSKELSGLKAVLGKDTDPLQLKALKEDAKAFGASTAFTALQVVQLQTEFAKLGFTTDQILNATGATLDLAAAAGVDLAEAATVAGATLRGFGLRASESQRIVDVMAKSFSSSSLDMSKFTESMKLVAPIAKTIRVPIEQATAALGVLADTGIHGSMAGTQLRRVMSDLAQKTGKSFRESLTLTSEKLKAATSDSQKLAIAKELVGDRAKGSLIALAENTEQLDKLTVSLVNAGGAAKEMADERLNNLDGDVTKLGSAWEGFILSLEDGDGIISKLSRGAVQGLTYFVGFLSQGLKDVSAVWVFMVGQFDAAKPKLKALGLSFQLLGTKATIAFNKMKLAAADVPLIGRVIDKAKAQAALKQAEGQLKKGLELIRKFKKEAFEIEKAAGAEAMRLHLGLNKEGRTQEEEAELKAAAEFREGKLKKDEEQRKKDLADKKAFLDKLKKLEQDTEDTTALEKIERKRQRHLAELATIKMNATERKKAEQDINNIYDQKAAEQKAKNLEKFEKMFGTKGQDPLAKIEADREAHLLELDALQISETEKEELKLRIKNHYDGLRNAVESGNAEKKRKEIDQQIAEERRLQEARRQALYQTLDTAAEVAGKETAMGKALMAIKLAMQLKELAIKMGLIKDELAIKAQAAMSEAGVEGAKVGTATAQGMAETSKIGFPWNIISMAGYALQAASLVKTFAGQKKKLANIAGKAGASGSGGSAGSAPPAPPSFNVIGGTSAGDELVASTISQVNDRPMRAYVVGGDVTTSQELQRNTETIASIG
jgi:TP901 family phage tail tape measure protein